MFIVLRVVWCDTVVLNAYAPVEDEMGGACGTLIQKENAYRVLVGKAKGKRPLGKPNHGWEDNIKIDIKGLG